MSWKTYTAGNGRGGGAGRGPSADEARITPGYLTVSADFHRRMGSPRDVLIQWDAEQRAIRLVPATGAMLEQSMVLAAHHTKNGVERDSARRRVSIGQVLKLMGLQDRIRPRGQAVDATIGPDGSTVFRLGKLAPAR